MLNMVLSFLVEGCLVPLMDGYWNKRRARKVFARKNTDLTFE